MFLCLFSFYSSDCESIYLIIPQVVHFLSLLAVSDRVLSEFIDDCYYAELQVFSTLSHISFVSSGSVLELKLTNVQKLVKLLRFLEGSESGDHNWIP